jgi:hypothetical protein
MVDSISEEHLLEYQKILYDISANIIFNPYNEYDLSKNLIKTIINELEKKKIYYNSILKELFFNNSLQKIEFCEKTINNYNNELIYTNYINKNIMYLYLFVDDSKEYIKEQYVLKKGFGSVIDYREYQLIQEYNVKLYLLGLFEIKNENYEKKYHNFNHLKDLKKKLQYLKKTKQKDISGNNIMKLITKDEIYEVSAKSIFEFFSYGIYMQNFTDSNNIELKELEYKIEIEKTKQTIEIEKTKQIEEETKQIIEIEKTKQKQTEKEEETKQKIKEEDTKLKIKEEETKIKIEETKQIKLRIKELELQIKLKELEIKNDK